MRLFVARNSVFHIVFTLLFVACATCLAQSPDDRYWDPRFGRSEIINDLSTDNTYVNALASSGDYVLVGGRYTLPSARLALWNKSTRSWVSGFAGIPGNDGTPSMTWGIAVVGTKAYLKGSFFDSLLSKQYAFGVLDLVTKRWTPDTSLVGDVRDFCLMGSDLIVSGSFTIRGTSVKNCGIIRNEKWIPFSADSSMNRNGLLVVCKNSLYLAQFLSRTMNLSRWNGTSWDPIIDSLVYRQGSFPSTRLAASSSRLFICAPSDSIFMSGATVVKGNWLYAYDGNTCEPLITSYTPAQFSSIDVTPVLATHNEDLYMMGPFSNIDGTTVNNIACWSGTTKTWRTVGGGVSANIVPWLNPYRALLCDGDDLYAAGIITTAGGKNVSNIARFSLTTNEWFGLTSSTSFGLNDFSTIYNDKGKILAVGSITNGGDQSLNGIGYWNGTRWQQLGSGLIGGTGYPNDGKQRTLTVPQGVLASTRFRDTLILAGEFGFISSLTCDNIARFDNGILDCVGGGVKQSHFGSSGHFETPAFVSDVLSINDKLYACGDFKDAGGTKVEAVAQWDGTMWKALSDTVNCYPYSALSLLQDSTHALLMVGSVFSISGKRCNGLARWDGSEWSPIGFFADDSAHRVDAACVAPNGDIIVAGKFAKKNGVVVNGLARWDGSQWHSLGSGVDITTDLINAMAASGDRLFVAGRFKRIGSIDAEYVAMFNLKTNNWSTLGSGFATVRGNDTLTKRNPVVHSIAILHDTVYFSGSFRYAGLQTSSNIAAWTKPFVTEVEQSNEQIDGQSGEIQLSVHPNPATSDVTVEWSVPESGPTRLIIYDMMGHEIKCVQEQSQSTGSYRMKVSTSTLVTGNYFVRCVSAHYSRSRILCVMHD